jgi:alanine dehydrogenase
MIIGVPKEVKDEEHRVSVTPSGVTELKNNGHRVLIEISAGFGSGFSDREYEDAGAETTGREAVFSKSELIVKVKEPVPAEFELFKEGQALFTYLHLAPNKKLIDFLLKKKITGLAYETLEVYGTLPLLMPMSEIAGKMAPVMAANFLQKVYGGEGVLMTGVDGAPSAKVLILGAGNVGMSALKVAHGMGADVAIVYRSEEKQRYVKDIYKDDVRTIFSDNEKIEAEVLKSDVMV